MSFFAINKASTFLKLPAAFLASPYTKATIVEGNFTPSAPAANITPTLGDINKADVISINILDMWASAAPPQTSTVGTESLSFCMPENPAGNMYYLHTQLNLFKIRNGMNISGVVRNLEPFAAPTDTSSGLQFIGSSGTMALPLNPSFKPSQYKFDFLIDRAKQLANIAQQMESMMLAALEKFDAETYSALQAKQQLKVAREQVKLGSLQVQRAEQEREVAKDQYNKADFMQGHFQDLVNQGLSGLELVSVSLLLSSASLNSVAASLALSGATLSTQKVNISPLIGPFLTIDPGSLVSGQAAMLSNIASSLSTLSNLNGQLASFERRKQEWDFQKNLASKDKEIANKQIGIAETGIKIAGQELRISELNEQNADETLTFLKNKFTSAELYKWMSNELMKIYFNFLNRATNMAKLAQNQLMFERQEVVGQYIADSYRSLPANGGDTMPDRKGLTGSARLLQDVYGLEQAALDTNVRKLQLTKTISLATLDPLAFAQFKETGIFNFATSLKQFDRDFPGHYLRLIKQVKTSVIALVSPIDGIKATLSTVGVSRVVTKTQTSFTVTPIYGKTFDSVALTSPTNATGIFEMQQVDNMLKPFEGLGVETQWVFELPKASNYFDYSTIADVLLTIDYTALNDGTYKRLVIEEMDDTLDAYKSYSFKNNFPDQWYDLNNQINPASNCAISLILNRADYPSALISDPTIKNISIYAIFKDKVTSKPGLVLNTFNYDYANGSKSGELVSLDANTNTIGGVGSAFSVLSGSPAFGTLQLNFTETSWFQNGDIQDLVLMINYNGDLPKFT
jgi:hypothetical protein